MNIREDEMKRRGEQKVWKTILSRSGTLKRASSTQIGQQIIFDDALRILPQIREWIEIGSATVYRRELVDYFSDDEFLLQKITESFLLLAGSVYVTHRDSSTKRVPTRHKRVALIQEKIMSGLSFDQTWRFLETIIEASEYFDVERKMEYRDNKASWSMKYICHLSEVIGNKLTLEAYLAFFPEPMVVPPIDWKFDNEILVGGYETYQYPLIRATSFKVDYTQYSKEIFDSVNYIQSVPWKINKELVLQVKLDLKFPEKSDYIKTTYPEEEGAEWALDLKDTNLALSDEVMKKIQEARRVFGSRAELYNAEAGDYESALGKYRAVKLALGIAEIYQDEEELYFPHSYDFRGRIYPLSVGLSPQGSDAIKAMLEYKRGEILTERGLEWCWAYLASLYGEDKIQFNERVVRGRELIDADYLEADEPYQFLAHQLGIKKYLENPESKSFLRIHLDACNSGSQFTSAITGDRAGCIATNVIPTMSEDGTQERKDAYLLVADKSLELTTNMISSNASENRVSRKAVKKHGETDKSILETLDRRESTSILKFFRKLLEESGRKICKTPVMVSNYGGTAGGRAEILWDTLRELGCERKWITKKNASLFSRIIGDSISGVLNGGKAFESYIHQMNNIIAKKNKPITWRTSDGFLIVHVKKKELKRKQVSCMLPGARRATTINKKIYSKDVSPVKMKSAIAPNYIHSLDAELLRKTALRVRDRYILDSDWIHDSFGCHPNCIDLMLELTKDEFKALARRQPLKILDAELRLQIDNSKASVKALAAVKLPQLNGFDVDKGELDIVEESDWFFS